VPGGHRPATEGEPNKETPVNLTRKLVVGGVLAASSLSAGAIGASLVGSANAQTTSTTAPASPSSDSSSSTATPSTATPQARPDRAPETPLTGADADKATAAALAAVPGATVDRVETDSDGATYEAHVTKSDGTKATVEMDANFTVTSVEADTGHGGRGGHGGPHQANGITETPLTGADADKATAAAQAAVPGATIDRVETDAEGATYEAHVTKSDGTKATVKMDSNFTVTSVEDGMK
jgi:uncharacterized membrane protein YkoI